MGGYDFNQLGESSIADSVRACTQNYEINLKSGVCMKRRPMLLARYSFGICVYGEYIFVVGGIDQVV